MSVDQPQTGALPPEAEAKMQALLAKQRAAKAEDAEYDLAKKRLWLSHNWPGEYERCAVVGGRHVCRRCSTLYPVALLVTVASFLGFAPWPASMDLFFIFALCVPATAEFLAEKILGWAYNSRRQVAVTFLLAPALGRGFWYEIQDRWTLEFWGPVLIFGAIWGFTAVNEARSHLFAQALQRSEEFGPEIEQPA